MPFKDKNREREWRANYRRDLRIIIDQAKNKPCADCNNLFPLVAMQFDHVKGQKKYNISSALAKAKSRQSLINEIAKCDVVCANCHAVRTYLRVEGKWKRTGEIKIYGKHPAG